MSDISAGTACFLVKDDSVKLAMGIFGTISKRKAFTAGERKVTLNVIGYI